MRNLEILVLEPYFGGSHKSFLDNLKSLPFNFTFMTLPARKWKWRMRLSAPYYGRQLWEMSRRFDRILCSSFVDVATLRGLGPPWVREVPLLTYFHENQFAYPVRIEDERDIHFSLLNVTTGLASDRLAFNSAYNLESFLEGARMLAKESYDLKIDHAVQDIKDKAVVIAPGIDFSWIDGRPEPPRDGIPVVLWNHRWEHDKDPETFFEALFRLDEEGLDFRLIVLGESYRQRPGIFDIAKERLKRRILHFGYVESEKEYAALLKSGDIAVSTANHEFFGMAVLEAVRAGCRPLLPRRLSYPGLFPEEYLYEEGDLLERLRGLILENRGLDRDTAFRLTEPHSWSAVSALFQTWLETAAPG